MKKYVLFVLMGLLCFAFTTEVQKRTIRAKEFDIECYVSMKAIKDLDPDKTYYWYKSGGVHESVYSVGGHVLHNNYTKYFRSNQLAEQGRFNYGLKTGIWKSWYENGTLKQYGEWKEGFKHGEFVIYDKDGRKSSSGSYKYNLRSGLWINYKTKQTTNYKKDVVQPKKEKPVSLFKRLFKKRDKSKNAKKAKKKSILKPVNSNKEGFFKRLFSKGKRKSLDKKKLEKKS